VLFSAENAGVENAGVEKAGVDQGWKRWFFKVLVFYGF